MKDDSNRSLRRVNRKSRSAADRTVEVDSSAFFAEDPSPTPPPRKKPGSSAPRRSGAPAQAAAARPSAFGRILLPVQGILSVASLVQLWRTQMLPVLYLVILAALLFLLWLLVKRCQEYNVPGKVSRVFSVFLCACMALGCVWAQQGLTALDNMTTTIIMVMLLRRLIANKKERWIFASVIVIAANSGGAWSPIGDVTTIMLWVRGNISTSATIPHLFLPSLVSALVPVLIISRYLHGKVTPPNAFEENRDNLLLKVLKANEKLAILCIGVFCLLFVPVFKTITHLPPFMGILMGVGILWIFTELMYRKTPINEDLKLRLSKVVSRIDGATLMFFLGILLAVDALRCSGVLGSFSLWLDDTIGNVYAVNLIIGTLSAIVDNVPLVAGAIGMYPVASDAMVATAADPAYIANFVQDGVFWQFLAYCAGVGGSMLIIGSAAGVVVMGLEGINFIWYLKRISLLALAGYLSGAAVYILQNVLLGI